MNDRLEIKGVKGAMPHPLLYYTRSVQNRRACVALLVVAISLPAAAAFETQTRTVAERALDQAGVDQETSSRLSSALDGLSLREERFPPEGDPAVVLRFFLKPESASRSDHVVEQTMSTLRRLTEWFGPFPFPTLTVIDAPWNSGLAGAAYPGVAVIGTRWLARDRDRSPDRSLIAALTRQYWFGDDGASPSWLREGLVLYTTTRVIHGELEEVDFASWRNFGGFVPVVVRSLQLSPDAADPRPRVRQFAEVDQPATAPWRFASAAIGGEAQRAALTVHSLERYIGWPAMLSILSSGRLRPPQGAMAVADLANEASRQRGQDLRWFFDEGFRFPARFDYGVDRVSSAPSAENPALFVTTVVLRRFGDGIFAGTNEPRDTLLDGARSLPVDVRFEDGTEVRDWWDGRDAEKQLTYTSTSRAQSVSVDPEAMLLLDADRANNTNTLRPRFSGTGARLALQWVAWLQDVMLTYSALV